MIRLDQPYSPNNKPLLNSIVLARGYSPQCGLPKSRSPQATTTVIILVATVATTIALHYGSLLPLPQQILHFTSSTWSSRADTI